MGGSANHNTTELGAGGIILLIILTIKLHRYPFTENAADVNFSL